MIPKQLDNNGVAKTTRVKTTSAHTFQRKQRKENVTVPLEPTTVKLLNDMTKNYQMSRAEIMRYCIEFSVKSEEFHKILSTI